MSVAMRKKSNIGSGECKPIRPLPLNIKLKFILGSFLFLSFFIMAIVKSIYTELIFTSLVIVAAIWSVVSGWMNLSEAIASRSWPIVKFTFVDGKINIKSPSAGKGSHTKYTPVFQLQYEYSGEKYTCSNDEIKRIKQSVFYTFQDAQEFLNQLRNGGLAYVCPQKPTILFMENGVSSKYFFGLIASVVITAIAFLVWLILVNDLYV